MGRDLILYQFTGWQVGPSAFNLLVDAESPS